MGILKRALAGPGQGIVRRLGVLPLLAVTACAAAAQDAPRPPELVCRDVNDGAMSVALEGQEPATRQVTLTAGDKLVFTFAADGSPLGTLSLIQGTGAPRQLLAGQSGAGATFTAPRAGTFAFAFANDGPGTASFSVSCVPAPGTAQRAAARVSLRAARLPEDIWTDDDALDVPEAAALEAPARATPPWASPPPLRPTPVSPASDLDMKLQWRGERYRAGGPDGYQIDRTNSGVDAALNYKLLPDIMIGALAQVEPPGEGLLGSTSGGLLENGWMAGPMTNIKLGSGLTLEARAAWGAMESMPDALSARTGSIERRAVSARLASTQSFGPWRLTPSVSVNHMHETASGVLLPAAGHDITTTTSASAFGRVDAGPELTYRIDIDKTHFIEPRAAIGTFWDFDTLSNLSPGAAGHGDLRLKAEAGVTIGTGGGTKLQAGGAVEEGAPGSANVWSGRLQLSVPIR